MAIVRKDAAALLIFAALWAAGCQRKIVYEIYADGPGWREPFGGGPTEMDPYAPEDTYKLVVDGRESGPYPIEKLHMPRLSIDAIDAGNPASPLPKIEARVHTICGWEDSGTKVLSYGNDDKYGFETHRPVSVEVLWERGDSSNAQLYVDNRNGRTDASLSVGERHATVAAGKTGTVKFPWWRGSHCEASRRIQLNGQDLVVFPKNKQLGAMYLLDTSTSHCYLYRNEIFGDPRYQTFRKYREPEFFRAQKVRELSGGFNFFLTEIPSSVTTQNSFENAVVRSSLEDAACR